MEVWDSWNNQLTAALEAGFEIITYRRFRNESGTKVVYPSMLIAAHRNMKVLLVATSSLRTDGIEVQDTCTVFGVINRHDPMKCLHFGDHTSSSFGDPRVEFASNGLTRFAHIPAQGTFINWGQHSLWINLKDSSQAKSEEEGLRERLLEEFLASAPDWVVEFMS